MKTNKKKKTRKTVIYDHTSSLVHFKLHLKTFSYLLKLGVRLLGGFCNWRGVKKVGGGCLLEMLFCNAFIWSDSNPRWVLSWITSNLYRRFAARVLVTWSSVGILESFSAVTSSKRKWSVSRFPESKELCFSKSSTRSSKSIFLSTTSSLHFTASLNKPNVSALAVWKTLFSASESMAREQSEDGCAECSS